jgi:CPA2 family monovalent cation:H+ antiporter-2
VARTGSRELFTLSVLAIAVGIAYGSAHLFGVSFALGAFFAGLVLSESDFSHRAGRDSLPLQDAFAVLFFVSVGMLFDPSIIVREPLKLAGTLALILVIKSTGAFFTVLILRYPVSTALTVAASLSQVGEFSFILAGLATMTGVLPPEGRDLIVAGALISISLNLLVFNLADILIARLEANRPKRGWPSRYGAGRFAKLQADLLKTRERVQAKEAARSLRARELVKNFPLFSELDAEQLQEILFLFRPRFASPGERLIRRGDWGDVMFFIVSGAVEVAIDGERLRLGAGEMFGEMALLSRSRRTADVTAIEYCQFMTLDRDEFRHFIVRHPGVHVHIRRLATERAEMNRKRLQTHDADAAAIAHDSEARRA